MVICLEQGADCLQLIGPADATAIPKPHNLLPYCMVLPFWYQCSQVVEEKRPLNGYGNSSSSPD